MSEPKERFFAAKVLQSLLPPDTAKPGEVIPIRMAKGSRHARTKVGNFYDVSLFFQILDEAAQHDFPEEDKVTLKFAGQELATVPVVPGTGHIPGAPSVPDLKEKAGNEKAPMWLLPAKAFLMPVAYVLFLGASKYGAWNWRRGHKIKLSVYMSAMARHWTAVQDGEWIDPESGQPHIAHIAATCAIVLDAHMCGLLKNDMPNRKGEPRER